MCSPSQDEDPDTDFFAAPNLDRLHNAHVVFHARPELLFGLLSSICGLSTSSDFGEDWTPAHSSFRASVAASANLDFLKYLLAIPSATTKAHESSSSTPRQLDVSTTTRLFRAVLDFLAGQLRDFLQSWKVISTERTSNIGNDVVEIMAIASTVTSVISVRCSREASASEQPPILAESRGTLADFIARQNVDNRRGMANRVCACVVALHKLLLQCGDDNYGDEYRTVLEAALNTARQGMASNGPNDPSDVEFFDDDPWESQATQNGQTGIGANVQRLDLPICQDSHALLGRYNIELTTAFQLVKSQGNLDSLAAADVFDEILTLDPASLIGARGAVQDFLSLETGTRREDAHRFIEKIGQDFLQEEALERCESALCFCLQTLRSLVDLWTAEEDDDLAAVSFDVYDWFLNTALGKGIGSPKVLAALSNLLDVLLRKNASFGGEDLPSPRTSLLKILEVANPASQHRLSETMSHIFEKYVLTQHEAIFDDIVGKLPADPDNKEGIAVRLFMVSHLGARWHTVLRQATYHVFETVAHVPSTTRLAHDCLARTCTLLGLGRPRQLFKLFSPQIFYTWLSKETLSLMPFQAFGYDSLQEMTLDNSGELAGQIALRGMSHAEELARVTGVEWSSLLTENFAHAEAYTLASETSVPKHDRLCDGSEKLVRKQLGSELYLQRLRDCLPDIITMLVVSLQDDRGVEKALPKTNLATWQQMLDQSSQNVQLPLSQQPCFRARCLPEEINYLCSRLDIQADDIWTPSLLVYMFRQLLDRARPALGPLHMCTIIRKIRIVISLAGSVALKGYPLEMMLHSLRPYLTLFECAEDAMGIYHFLLRQGAPYLATKPSFIAGLGVAIFASLTGFITSSQNSTTQESHFLATMTKAQEFRGFLGQYLESLQLKNTTSGALRTYTRVVQHAKAITQTGNSTQSTSEGQLLYALLMDQSSEDPLLSKLHFELSIGILCQRFSISPDYQDDILADDEDASKVLPVLEGLLKRFDLDRFFRIWAAQGIGRGFIMRGLTSQTTKKAGMSTSSSLPQHGLGAVASYTNILRHLVDLLWKSYYPASTSLEHTLQLISSNLSHVNEDTFFEPDLDKSFVRELSFGSFPCPAAPLSLDPGLTDVQEEVAHISQVQSQNWAAELLSEISESAAGDPVLGFLKPLIVAVPGSADILLPYGVHLILLGEFNSRQIFREKLSQKFTEVLSPETQLPSKARPLVLQTLLYLRKCHLPHETQIAQRNSWLEVDLCHAAMAASDCQMWQEALLFLELHYSQAQLQTGRSSRRSFAMANGVPPEVVSRIYENVDDPDFFYGKSQTYDLRSVISKMSHEGASQKSLSFHSAMLDSQLRVNEHEPNLPEVARTTASTLSAANMQGLSEAVKQHYDGFQKSTSSEFGRDLAQWDLFPPGDSSSSSTALSSLFRSMHSISSKISLAQELEGQLLSVGDALKVDFANRNHAGHIHSKLAILAEARQIVGAASAENLESTCATISARNQKVKLAE